MTNLGDETRPTSTQSHKAAAAVTCTTVSVPEPSSCRRCTKTSQTRGFWGEAHCSETHFPINHAILLLMIRYLKTACLRGELRMPL
jgi:hypothetical protein